MFSINYSIIQPLDVLRLSKYSPPIRERHQEDRPLSWEIKKLPSCGHKLTKHQEELSDVVRPDYAPRSKYGNQCRTSSYHLFSRKSVSLTSRGVDEVHHPLLLVAAGGSRTSLRQVGTGRHNCHQTNINCSSSLLAIVLFTCQNEFYCMRSP